MGIKCKHVIVSKSYHWFWNWHCNGCGKKFYFLPKGDWAYWESEPNELNKDE